MFSAQGYRVFLEVLKEIPGVGARFVVQGQRIEQVFPCDVGYPKTGDTDEANTAKGDYVLTWRFTIPKGFGWGATPADMVELVKNDMVLFKDRLDGPFLPSLNYPTVVYVNIHLERRL